MEKQLLKSAFFGFSKQSVCEYIAKVNEDFRNRILSLNEEHKAEKAHLSEKIAALESELAEYKQAHENIAAALLEAQQYAVALKEKADEENRIVSEANAAVHKAETERLNRYRAAIDSLRKDLGAFAIDTDEKLVKIADRSDDILKEFEEQSV